MKVLFVCTGNTCRSPMAEGYLKSCHLKGVEVISRGIYADGSPVSENSMLCMRELGIDISNHVSTQLDFEDLKADKIFCLSPSHRDALIVMGADENKISVLGGGIFDPYGGSLTHYRACRDEIIAAVEKLVLSGEFTPFYLTAATQQHLKDIAELERECFSQPWSENAIFESMSANTSFFVVTDGKKTLGYAGLSTVLDEGYVTNVAVTASARRMGVGSMLINGMFALARQKALSFISLEVRASNQSAQALYAKYGFEAVGCRRNFYSEPVENAVIMTKRFDLNEDIKY